MMVFFIPLFICAVIYFIQICLLRFRYEETEGIQSSCLCTACYGFINFHEFSRDFLDVVVPQDICPGTEIHRAGQSRSKPILG